MREERIIVKPFVELKVEEYESVQEVNEHVSVRLKGQIPYDKKEEYMQKCWQSDWVQIIAVSEGNEYILFCGIVTGGSIQVIGNTCSMELNLRSGTILMDEKKKIRSFQAEELTYHEVLEVCNRGYDNIAVITSFEKERLIEQFVMQYMETDWEFIKRLASLSHSVVLSECQSTGIKYSLGLPESEEISIYDQIEYQVLYDTEEYQKRINEGMDVELEDVISYVYESREIYGLGCWKKINGRHQYIWKIRTEMRGNELYHTYYMRPKKGILKPIWYNENLSGVTLFGVVSNVIRDRVQIKLDEDENREQSAARWFPYATAYSSSDGSGWYCMPEIGDKVRLYFPNKREQEAYVVSTYHEEGAELRKDPKCKFWRNKEGKEIQLAPGKILLTNNNGTYIGLSDTEGVNIVSGGPVVLSSKGMLRISSLSSSIELNAPNKIKLKQGDTEMSLGGDLNMSGAQIKL